MTHHLEARKPKPDLSVLSWMEFIDLPDLNLHKIKVGFDTGARTSARRATQIETFTRNMAAWVRFQLDIEVAESDLGIEAPAYDTRHIKNTSGISQEKMIIKTPILTAGRTCPIAVSFTNRSNMRLSMIVGRSALKKQNIAVHTCKINLASK